MIARCLNPKATHYANYGGRGITVCDRWRNDFAAFYSDMGPRPSPKHQIERRDNDGPYSKENCAWASQLEQANNKRNNVRLTFDGQTLTLPQWARRCHLPEKALWLRVNRHRWPAWQALTTPLNGSRHAYLTLNGETKSVKEWSKLTGLGKTTIHQRLYYGWTVERALTALTRRLLTLNGVSRSVREWAKVLGFSKSALKGRLRAGWPVERALTEPLNPR